jgi:hypothetical protein
MSGSVPVTGVGTLFNWYCTEMQLSSGEQL